MAILNLISVMFWLYIAYRATTTFFGLRDQGLSRREVTAVTILLLCGLNISRGLISATLHPHPGHILLEYFYIGSSVFQILLCDIILKYINSTTNKKSSEE